MGRKKNFTTNALASLTGKPLPALQVDKIVEAATPATATETTTEAEVIEKAPEKKAPKKAAPATKKKVKAPIAKKAKAIPNEIQNPNKRSSKSVHTPVTLYLNAANLNKLKEHADKEAQKISWLIDEMIYDYLIEHKDD